ncbi:Hypothetical protein, putative [Bodo saltans]|uniref:Uncharacterized protein n=1 Tax=Bodo saltans TaxID=75058 RepID=A0A0S4IXE1_BODSA|nr:Hypothetical protein, putative [Bodo saltans]|eukprot:CUG06554.1 Hypothetical protein, putative [Bodo saltans]
MERRYHMMIERDNHRAEKRMHEDEKHQRRLDEELLEARHVVHQNIAKERRRDEAKQKAADLQDERRKEIEAAIQLRDMKVKYTKWRQGIAAGQQLQPLGGPRLAGRGGGGGGVVALQGFSNIARRNHEMIAM